VASGFLAALTAPAVFALRARRIPPALSIPLLVVAMLLVAGGVAGFLGASINQFLASAPSYEASLNRMMAAVSEYLIEAGFVFTGVELRELVNPGAALNLAGRTLAELADLLSNLFLVLLTTVFLLLEVTELPDKLRQALGDPKADLGNALDVVRQVKNYVVLKTHVSLATGALIAAALAVFGIDFPVLWGLLAFLLNYIPNIGSIIAAVPAVLLALVQFGWTRALAVTVLFLVVNTAIGNLLEPRLMGRQMGLSPLVVFVSLVFWGWLWGPLGMLLSVPLTMILRIVLENNPQTRGIAILMGTSHPAAPAEPRQDREAPV
jgi:predicted PurR-regulated permease PerM